MLECMASGGWAQRVGQREMYRVPWSNDRPAGCMSTLHCPSLKLPRQIDSTPAILPCRAGRGVWQRHDCGAGGQLRGAALLPQPGDKVQVSLIPAAALLLLPLPLCYYCTVLGSSSIATGSSNAASNSPMIWHPQQSSCFPFLGFTPPLPACPRPATRPGRSCRRFPGRTHHVWLEPEGLGTDVVYPNGISNSMEPDDQLRLLQTIPGGWGGPSRVDRVGQAAGGGDCAGRCPCAGGRTAGRKAVGRCNASKHPRFCTVLTVRTPCRPGAGQHAGACVCS